MHPDTFTLTHQWSAQILEYCTLNPPTPADGKGERVREERLWTNVDNKKYNNGSWEAKVAEQQQKQGATAAAAAAA